MYGILIGFIVFFIGIVSLIKNYYLCDSRERQILFYLSIGNVVTGIIFITISVIIYLLSL